MLTLKVQSSDKNDVPIGRWPTAVVTVSDNTWSLAGKVAFFVTFRASGKARDRLWCSEGALAVVHRSRDQRQRGFVRLSLVRPRKGASWAPEKNSPATRRPVPPFHHPLGRPPPLGDVCLLFVQETHR